jgi:hypothetical protein
MTRIYKKANIFNARIIGMRNLWEPSKEYMGRPVEKPNYLVSIVLPKTRANWFDEPLLAGFRQACQELYDAALSHIPFAQVVWPIIDGDIPNPGRAPAAWRQGHWLLNGSSSTPITVTIIQNGIPVPLMNRALVKSGDYVGVSTAIAVKTNDPRGIKVYINNVMFMAEGEEIVVGTSVSSANLMADALAQGLNVTGYGGSGAPQQGFMPPSGGGFAPPPVNPASQPAPVPFGSMANSSASFPSNGPQQGFAPPPIAPPAQQGFGIPGASTAPTGFPPRQ